MSDAAAKVREILPGIYLLHLPLPMRPTIVNVYLIDGGTEWVLVDTGLGTEASLDTLREAFATIGVDPRKITKVVGTHHHPDHFGTSAPLRELTGAEFWLHPLERARMALYVPQPRPPETVAFFARHGLPIHLLDGVPSLGQFWADSYKPTTPDHDLADGDEIRAGHRTLRIVWTPGHTPGHCVVLLPKEKVLVVGDHLLPKITPHIGMQSDAPADPLGDFLASLRKVGELDVEHVLPAHGGVYEDHRKRVKQLVEFHEWRLDQMADVVRGRPRTAYETALEAFGLSGESPLAQQFPATFETLAHLERLRRDGRLVREDGSERAIWRAASGSRA